MKNSVLFHGKRILVAGDIGAIGAEGVLVSAAGTRAKQIRLPGVQTVTGSTSGG